MQAVTPSMLHRWNCTHHIPTVQCFKTRSFSHEDSEHFKLYNMLSEKAFASPPSTVNVFGVRQALLSLGQSCRDATRKMNVFVVRQALVNLGWSKEAEVQGRKLTYFTVGRTGTDCPFETVCCVAKLYKTLCLKHTKNERNQLLFKNIAYRDGAENIETW